MTDPTRRYDRRTFLARGAGTAAAFAMAGAGGSALLAACGSSPSSGTQSPRGTPGVSTATPKRGGSITIGMNSEIDGFLPSTNHFDNTGLTYATTVYDSMTKIGLDGQPHPYLAQSVTPNSDYTQWTVTLRPGVTFHDGSTLDANVGVQNFEAIKSSALTGQAVAVVESVKQTGDLEMLFTCTEPFVAFAHGLATQLGYVVALSQLNSSKGSQNPVGTGPFKIVEWVPNDHFTVERNPHYWQSNQPYLDQITFKPIIEDQSRLSSLRSGTIDLMVTHDPNAVVTLRSDPNFQLVDDINQTTGQPDMGFICLNTTAAPLNDVTVRQALAYATNAPELVRLFGAGVQVATNSLFPDGSPYKPADNGYPSYDLTKAKQLMSQAAPSHGGSIELTLGTIPDPRQTEILQALQNMWQLAGAKVSITTLQQVAYIDNLVTGAFQAYADEMFAATDPDLNYVWLSDTTASGAIALNFARNKDPQVEAALQKGRTSPAMSDRIDAYQTVDKLLSKDVPYIWISRSVWSMGASNKVLNFANPTLPGGIRGEGFRAGTFTPSAAFLAGA